MTTPVNKYNYIYKFGLKLKPTTKAIIDFLLKNCNDKGFTKITQQRIAKELNIERTTIYRHIKKIENIKIGNGLPFIKVIRSRKCDGKYNINLYYFPWINSITGNKYFKEHQLDIINKLIEEYSEILIEQEIYNYHVAERNKNNKKDRVSISFIQKLVKKLSKILKMNVGEVLKILLSIAERISQGETIFNLDSYLIKAFKLGKMQYDAKEIIKKIYQSLGLTGTDIHCIDWQSYANDLLTI